MAIVPEELYLKNLMNHKSLSFLHLRAIYVQKKNISICHCLVTEIHNYYKCMTITKVCNKGNNVEN